MSLASQEQIRENEVAPFRTTGDDDFALTGMATSTMLLQGNTMERLFTFAEMMAKSQISVPDHFKGKPSDCLAIALQATRWNMDPFVVAQKTHVINGRLGYEAQLVNAVVQNSGAIRGEFDYEFRGEKGHFECRVGAERRSTPGKITWGEWLSEADVTTKNSPLWKVNPKQQLGYLQVKNWARLYTPGAILGVYTAEELRDPDFDPEQGSTGQQPAPLAQRVEPVAHPKLKDADAAAKAGVAAYTKFWAEVTKDERLQLAPGHEARKQVALKADENRTVDATAKPVKAAKATAAPPAGITPTFDGIKAAMEAARVAKNLDALNVAADLIGTIKDEAQAGVLGEQYEAILSELS